jgi:hypothetical protein
MYFAFTQYWKEVLEKQGVRKPIHILRHGFDPLQFVPLERGRMREKHNISEDKFVILNLNRNTPRKHHDIVVTAFAELIARHPEKPLMLLAICDGGETGGYPLIEIFMRELVRLHLNPQQHGSKFVLSNTSMTFTGLLPGSSYTIIVTARNDTLSEVVSNTLTIFTELVAPEITTNILSSNRIQVTWSNYTGPYDTTKQLLNGSNVTNLSGNYTTAAGSVLTSDFLNLIDNTYYNIAIAISNVANGLTDASSNTIEQS